MIPVLGFCGASNSGKTTLVCKVIAELKGRGLKVGAVKHHGHAGPLALPDAEKDSGRLAEAGAERVALAHGGGVFLTAGSDLAQAGPLALAQGLMSGLDLVLVEGYKFADIDKIEVVAPQAEPILPAGGRLAALAKRGGGPPRGGLEVLDADDPRAVADFALKHLGLSAEAEAPKVRLLLDGREIKIKPFVAGLFESTLKAMAHTLKGGEQAEKIEVHIG